MSYLDNPTTRGSAHNPFRTYSNYVYPRTIQDVFTWAMWFWDRNAKYRTAIQKVVSYFVSNVTITNTQQTNQNDTDSVDAFQSLLIDNYSILPMIVNFGIQLASMGNVFVSAERVFSRQLICPNKDCHWIMNLKKLKKNRDYKWDGQHFVGKCPQCHRDVTFKIKDAASVDDQGRKVRFIFRDPRDMRIQFNRLSGTFKYFYKLPQKIKDAIQRGDAVYLQDSPKVYLQAATSDSFIEFPSDRFFAMRTTTLSSLDSLYQGWGVPLFMSSFDNLIRLQHLDKFNEAVTMDYIAPVRVLSPAPQNLSAGADPNRQPVPGAMFRDMMQQSLKKVKQNPTTWIVSPVPINYQMLGGQAKNLAPVDLMEWYTSQILADMGIPQEFKQTNFQVVAPTMGLRMFERQWIHFAKNMDMFTKWASQKIADAHNYEDMDIQLDTTSFVEDDMNKQVRVSMMQAGVLAQTPIFKSLGVDFKDNAKMKIREQKEEEEIAREMQDAQQNAEMIHSVLPPAGSVGIGQAQGNIDRMQQEAAAAAHGGMPAGPEQPGMPAAPMGPGGPSAPMAFNQGNSQSASIEQMFQEAQSMAQQIYNLPPNQRRAQLVQLKTQNPTMHAQVKQILSDMEGQVASEAVAQSKMPQG